MSQKPLRNALLQAQLQFARDSGHAMVVVLSGHTTTTVLPLLNALNHWLENRGTEVHALETESRDRSYPDLWRYWRRIPARGRIGIFVHGWYNEPLFGAVERRIGSGAAEDRSREIRHFEASLAHAGVIVCKLWLDIDAKQEATELQAIAADPARDWQCEPDRWVRVHQHAAIVRVGDTLRQRSEAPHASWTRIDARDPAAALETSVALLTRAMQRGPGSVESPSPQGSPLASDADLPTLGRIAKPLSKREYRKQLPRAQGRLGRQIRRLREAGRPLILVFEGVDAAGKGGTLHRITEALDPRYYRVHSIAAPNDVERLHPWPWRFWSRLPRDGRIAIFDRSWFGRVLVERVEGFASETEWRRAYDEIREFERAQIAHGAVLARFLLDLDADTQLQRFEKRRDTPHKQHKLTDEDWRNRERWDEHQQAFTDAIAQTHQPATPWFVIPAQCKRRARIEAIEHLERHIRAMSGWIDSAIAAPSTDPASAAAAGDRRAPEI